MGLHIFWESKVIAISFGGSNWWSDLIWCSFGSDLVLFSSCVHLSTTNLEHLGSITSLEVIKAQLVRNEFTCSCSFLARHLVSGPWFVYLMLDGEFLTFEVSYSVGMSSSFEPPPFIYIGGTTSLLPENWAKPPWSTNHTLPRVMWESVGPIRSWARPVWPGS